jgi:predicted small secreted protein
METVMKSMKLVTLAALSALFLATACETMEGFGRDVEKGGDNIEDAAQDAK